MFNQIVKRHRPVAFHKKTELGSGYAHHLPAAHAAPEWPLATIEPCRRERQTQQESSHSSVTSSQVTTSHDIPTNQQHLTSPTRRSIIANNNLLKKSTIKNHPTPNDHATTADGARLPSVIENFKLITRVMWFKTYNVRAPLTDCGFTAGHKLSLGVTLEKSDIFLVR
jgi:hypothetical protein